MQAVKRIGQLHYFCITKIINHPFMHTRSLYFISAAVTSLFLWSCSGNNSTSSLAAKPGAPNTDYKPAFEGQTKIGRVKTATSYKVEKIADHLGIPWAIIPIPDGRLLLTEKTGYMEIVSTNGVLLKKIT